MAMVSHAQANNAMLRKLLVVACVMFGFGFAMVPFYKKICDTGFTAFRRRDGNCATIGSRCDSIYFHKQV